MRELILVENRIFNFRGQPVMIDRDLAEMYQVETKVLNQAVKRNIERFPDQFRFQLTAEELEGLKSQIVTSSRSQFVTLNKSGRGKKWFTFSKLEANSVTILNQIKALI